MIYRGLTDDQYRKFSRKIKELSQQIEEGNLSFNKAMDILNSLSKKDFNRADPLIPEWAISPVRQRQLVWERNEKYGWGFTKEDFDKLGEPPPWLDGKLSAVVLDVSLDTVPQTFTEAWRLTREAQPGYWYWEKMYFDEEHLRLFTGIKHQRGLRWRIVDLAANWDKEKGIKLQDARDARTSPTSAILWAASYFPKWVQLMDGINVPYVWISGYEFNIPSYDPWSKAPFLCWYQIHRQVRLSAHAVDYGFDYWAIPVFRD